MTGWCAPAVAALLLAAGCTNLRSGTRIPDGDPPTSKAELFQRFGLPDAERRGERRRWLRYDAAETGGVTVGFGLVFGRSHRTDDTVWVAVDEGNRVVALERGRDTTRVDDRLWPFGD